MDYKTVPFELKQLDEAGFCGYASTFGLDEGGDIILPGAFKKTIAERAARIKICYQHDWRQPIGKPIEMHEDEHGLYVKAMISDTALGRDVRTLMKDGVVTELSIGYDTMPGKVSYSDVGGQNVRVLSEVRLYEISPVTVAMNPGAVITDVKSETPGDPDERFDAALALLVELKEGRVLSGKNRGLVQAAIEALQSLLAAAEPSQQPDATEEAGVPAPTLTAQDVSRLRASLRLKLLEV